MHRKALSALLAGWVFFASCTSALASVSGNMDAYWSNGLSAASVTGPGGAYTAQAGGYYTGGNISMRTPQKTYQLASVALPDLKGGCGGIDLFSGAFSFIGADQLIAMIKGIASNAAPYAFMLALQLISSPIADQLKTFEKWAQDINSFNINSCEAAEKIVDGAAQSLLGQESFCQRLGREHGTFSDAVAARNGCAGNNALSAAQPQNAQEQAWSPINRNIAWEAIKNHPLLQDQEMKELMMTVMGSTIIACPSDATSIQSCQNSVLPPKGGQEDVLTALLDGGDVTIYHCDTQDQCLAPTMNTSKVTIPADHALRSRVNQMLSSIIDSIRTRTPLTTAQIQFVNMTSLPVYKMASVYASQSGVSSDVVMGQYAEAIAIDMAYTWLLQQVGLASDGAHQITGITPDLLKGWQDSVASVRAEILQRQQKTQVQATALEDMVARTQAAEAVLSAKAAGRIAESIAYSTALQR